MNMRETKSMLRDEMARVGDELEHFRHLAYLATHPSVPHDVADRLDAEFRHAKRLYHALMYLDGHLHEFNVKLRQDAPGRNETRV